MSATGSRTPAPPLRRRLTALATAAASTVAGAALLVGASPAHAMNGPGTPPYWAQSPFSVPSGTGASLPFTEYEAEASTTTGTRVGPDFTQGSLASEASGREAVQLTGSGQYVQFTLTSAANAFDLRYSLAQGASGSLSVYVNGTKQSKELSLTSAYSYISTGGITGSKTHKFFDDTRMMFGQTLAAGTTVKVQVDSSDSAVPYTVDVADFYNVPTAASQPAGSVSVVTEGADPTGANDSSNAFNTAINAANAANQSVWIPPGTYLVTNPIQTQKATIVGAGNWYSQIKTNMFIRNSSAVSGPVNLSGFAILGSTVGRHDDSSANGIDGSLGNGFTVNGLWIQDTNVGFWLQYGNSNGTVENTVVESTDADGLNFNGNASGNASGNTVKNNFLRGTGDDALAIWSYPTADSNITFANNTIVAPTLANGIADYGGANNTISNNVIADDNALGSGLTISNEAFLQPFSPLSGTITVSGNYLIRAGAYNPNWAHPMGAVQFDSYDSDFSNVTVNYSGGAILDSPYEAFEIVGGDGTGHVVNGLNISNVKVQNTGTTVFQAETGGAASVSGLTASGLGVSGTYNNSYPGNVAGAYTFNLGSGNSGWSTTPVLTTFPDPVQPGALHASPAALSFGDVKSGTTSAPQSVTVTNPGTSAAPISSISATGPFSQTNNCGSSLAAGASCTAQVTFAPTTGGNATGTLTVATSAPGGPLSVALSGRGITSTTNLALGQPATASSTQGTFVAGNATDGNTGSYWESADGAGYPQTITVDLGSTQPIGSTTLNLPPSSAWGARTQTLSILGSTDGTNFTQIVGSAAHTFDPASGNTATIALPSGTSARYVRLSFTGNTGWSAAQLSEFQIFPGGAANGSALTANPSNVSFGSVAVGSTSSAQTVTVSNPGGTAAAISSISTSAPFSQTNTCGTSLAAGASCTVKVTFTPTTASSANGTLSVASNAPGSPLTVALSGTGTSTGGNTNLALNKPTTASGTTQNYTPGNTVDGNTSSYWESTDNAFPQWLQVDLGASASVSRIVMDLPPSSSWGARTQTIQIQGSTDGTNFTTLAPSHAYTFDPATGNTATATFTAATVRYVRLTFTANTGWPAGQLSELQVFSQ
ncbi:coagulation factor 5/8 type domain protein [Catenulispora acidiphila DSM 44928]|uniref:Coagulation factor 5/8 type domain protein n=1 Tax=Catenulispora acidiphila (strain DSM 44928 / JCM 14897 / NBRC 102108 / NRRL B-24433 / ID139908) TaxID=479433 RepID=C7Q7K8_CATAD|nr:discoidin domain-containing protein [Catenulispora acidiphila]ACU72201.1 coagulation factor 5/8 type domain protein [Catenulispora acidiphila DSM 44928]